jgi:hypothetical protein
LYDQDSIQGLHNARKAGLSDFDAYSLNLYTDSTLENYKSLNSWLRFGADRRQGNKTLSESIQEALTKLPSYK